MNKKQKRMLYRILAAFALFFALELGEKAGAAEWIGEFPWGFLMFLVPYLLVGWDIVYKAVRNISHGQVFDENFLMTLATIGAFGVGEYAEAVAVMLFYQVGELFQSYAVNRSRQSISDLMDICPEYVNIEEDGELKQVDPDEVSVGSLIVIKAGERIPLDGVVVSGESMVDTSALTGESVPRRVAPGSEVISGCVNGGGLLQVRTIKEFEDSTVAKILELVENASSKKAKVENFITRFARYYTPVVVIGAVLLAVLPPLLAGGGWGEWIQRACTFLVISCPCALVISVPLSFFGGVGAASRIGVLVKGSNYLEALSELDTIVFDKTGTLTKGEFKVSAKFPAEGIREEALLKYAAYAESYSNHPIAASIREAYTGYLEHAGQAALLDTSRVSDAKEISGEGVWVQLDGRTVYAGNEMLMKRLGIVAPPCDRIGTVVYVAGECEAEDTNTRKEEHADKEKTKKQQGQAVFFGTLVISDTIKEEAPEAIQRLKEAGVRRTVMLTGDRRAVGEAVAKELGLDEVHAELLPADKVSKVETLLGQEAGKQKLAFVGDGINDAPVLTRADIGIAMGSMGSDAAIEAADVVLMDDDTEKIARVIRIARKTMAIVRQNIVFALGVKFLVLILGALGYANMWAAVFADVGVSVIAILNAMRTLRSH